jgi:hypothetical protein
MLPELSSTTIKSTGLVCPLPGWDGFPWDPWNESTLALVSWAEQGVEIDRVGNRARQLSKNTRHRMVFSFLSENLYDA